MKRNSGYYWILVSEIFHLWVVAYWDSEIEVWYFTGNINTYRDEDLIRINEEQIQPPIK